MEKSGIPQKQILEEIMKHTHRIIRLLTLAVVSCALAALLSGCTKEEFIAGYNEFLFGDWFPSPPSAGETTAAEGSASGDSGHVYAEPNPECDAKISSLMSELYSLESSARSDVSSAIQSAKDEYHALPASQRTFANKVSIAYKHLSSVESTYDSAVSSVVSEMRSVLTMSVLTESEAELLKSNHFRNSAAELNTSGSRKCISDHSSFRLF